MSPSSKVWYRRKLGSKQPHHATHWPHCIYGPAASAGAWLSTIELDMSDIYGYYVSLLVINYYTVQHYTTYWILRVEAFQDVQRLE